MAIIRCKLHELIGRTRKHVASVEPVGYPTTALVVKTQHWYPRHKRRESTHDRRPESTLGGRSGPRPWTGQMGGERS